MISEIAVYLGSIIIIGWGIAHLFPIKKIVASFGELSPNSKYILIMEWLGTGIALIFTGLQVFIVTILFGTANSVVILVYQLNAFFLLILTVVHLFTGFRTTILPIQLCPVIMVSVAILFLCGNLSI